MLAQVATPSSVAQTERLLLRRLAHADAPFIRRLVNEPSWIRHIGERHVHTLDDARRYLDDGPLATYARHGFGLYLVLRKDTGEAAGICGLVKRDALDDADLGFAFLTEHWGNGYARESARAVLSHARTSLGLSRVVAIVSRDNERSSRLLVRIGFRLEGRVRLRHDDDELDLYARDLRVARSDEDLVRDAPGPVAAGPRGTPGCET